MTTCKINFEDDVKGAGSDVAPWVGDKPGQAAVSVLDFWWISRGDIKCLSKTA